jgi:hypothetical protein
MTQEELEKEVREMFVKEKYITVAESKVKQAIHDHGTYIKTLNSRVENGTWGK